MSAGVPETTEATPAPPAKPAYKGWAGIRRAFGTPSALTMALLGFGLYLLLDRLERWACAWTRAA